MATFSELQTRVGQIIIDLPATVTAQLPTLVNEALREIQRLNNFYVMEATTAVMQTTASSPTLAALPSDWKEWRGKPQLIEKLGQVTPLEIFASREEAQGYFGTTDGGEATVDDLTGTPRGVYLSEPANTLLTSRTFQLYPIPDQLSTYANGNYRVRVPYWRYLPRLSAGSDQNWFTVECEEWIVFKAASMAFFDNHDPENGAAWMQLAAQKKQEAVAADKRARAAGIAYLIPQQHANVGPHERRGGFLPFRWRF